MTISNTDEVIDSRDIIERIDDLSADRALLVSELETTHDKLMVTEDDNDEAEEIAYEQARDALKAWDASEEAVELAALTELAEKGASYSSDWQYGETLIQEFYWKDYVREMIQDIGDLPKEIPPYIAIDWEQTAKNIAVDYTTIDFDGVSYYIRAY